MPGRRKRGQEVGNVRRKWKAGGAMVLKYKGDEGWEGGELREARPGRLRTGPGNS